MTGEYLTRRRFYIPVKEHSRHYVKRTHSIALCIFPSEYEENDPVSFPERSEDSYGD